MLLVIVNIVESRAVQMGGRGGVGRFRRRSEEQERMAAWRGFQAAIHHRKGGLGRGWIHTI